MLDIVHCLRYLIQDYTTFCELAVLLTLGDQLSSYRQIYTNLLLPPDLVSGATFDSLFTNNLYICACFICSLHEESSSNRVSEAVELILFKFVVRGLRRK
jgi:hypothetical protein